MINSGSKVGTTSIAAIMTSLSPPGQGLESGNLAMDAENHDLLRDPNLVENYSDILEKKPNRFTNGGGGNGSETDNESESVSGSVVVTRNSANSSPLKNRASLLSNTSSHYSVQLGKHGPLQEGELEKGEEQEQDVQEVEDEGEIRNGDSMKELELDSPNDSKDQTSIGSMDVDKSPTGDMAHEYEYSDSDFEESMEKRLHDMNNSTSLDKHDDRSESELEDPVLRLSLSEVEGSESDGELAEETRSLTLGSDGDSEADSELDEYQPLTPPKELDPEKLYALYAFNGPDPSHCQLKQDESCTLLNDQDSYWWLVKRSQDSKIGFAPAEILETFPERLARLNCWKNENMSSSLDDSPKASDIKNCDELVNGKDKESSSLENYMKNSKSVSFNDVVSYADRFIEANDDAEDYDTTHYDQFSEAKLKLTRFPDDEEMSEVVSDVSFNTAAMTPLTVEKIRRPRAHPVEEAITTSTTMSSQNESDLRREANRAVREESDDLRKIFEAPIPPFSKTQSSNGPNMQPSNSDYSISTIGDFSPSSSEWTNESPQLHDAQFNAGTDTAAIPPSRAIQDFSKYVEEEQSDGEATSICKSVESNADLDKKASDTENLPENKHGSLVSTSFSSEQIFLDSGRANSFTSINSATSLSRQHSSAQSCSTKRHPVIDRLYNPVFDKMDELMAQLDEVARE
ncbi:hypothetical protein HG536_0G02810 [Torulaspora globosa]|uniref:SH3 domain-containing protein n=1 Tax=Torulaspora globosa TaxID=48254 RepID=A0A7G3ZLN4_9SACH|nr:uncharacterized protein HG536_0G02810 [Torulaspora globosa]QLL34420.1 hypothetical protein HG536_0G02810 [Torulaspora globosa]